MELYLYEYIDKVNPEYDYQEIMVIIRDMKIEISLSSIEAPASWLFWEHFDQKVGDRFLFTKLGNL